MSDSQDRDTAIDRWLRRAAGAPPGPGPNDACLDAEVMAAWADGGLPDDALRAVRAHVADCQRCQVLAAVMARLEPAAAASAPKRAARRWIGWLVPLAAAAGAVVLWIALPRETALVKDSIAVPVTQIAQAPAAPEAAPAEQKALAARQDAPAATTPKLQSTPTTPSAPTKNEAGQRREQQADAKRDPARANVGRVDELRDRVAAAPAAAPPPPPPVPTAPTQAAEASASRLAQAAGRGVIPTEIVAADGSVHWRFAGAELKKSVDAGRTWQEIAPGVPGEFTAGAAVSQSICWLVGKAGLVVLTTDGSTWRRLQFPEPTDLSSVRATDARNAVVTAADGREFVTTDGGVTWIRRV